MIKYVFIFRKVSKNFQIFLCRLWGKMFEHETQLSIADYLNHHKGQSSEKYNNDKDGLWFGSIEGKDILLNIDLWIKLA